MLCLYKQAKQRLPTPFSRSFSLSLSRSADIGERAEIITCGIARQLLVVLMPIDGCRAKSQRLNKHCNNNNSNIMSRTQVDYLDYETMVVVDGWLDRRPTVSIELNWIQFVLLLLAFYPAKKSQPNEHAQQSRSHWMCVAKKLCPPLTEFFYPLASLARFSRSFYPCLLSVSLSLLSVSLSLYQPLSAFIGRHLSPWKNKSNLIAS